jgi:hypothetical protein
MRNIMTEIAAVFEKERIQKEEKGDDSRIFHEK